MPLVYSLDVFLPIIDFSQQEAWRLDVARGGWGWALMIWYWVEVGFGWIISSLLVLGLTGVVRQD